MSFDEMFEYYREGDAYDEMDARFGWELRNNEVAELRRLLRRAQSCTGGAAGGLCTECRSKIEKALSPPEVGAGETAHNAGVTGLAPGKETNHA